MTEKKMKAKELKRKNIMDSMQRIEDFLRNYTAERDANEVAIRLARLDTLMETFEAIQGEYEAFDDKPEFVAANAKVRAKVEEQYFRVKGGLVSKNPPLPPIPVNPAIQQGAPAIAHVTGVKLPTIELPRFDGDLNEWLTFHDSFSSLIHSSPEIPCIQKFQYLRSALRGDALKLIESLTITANNYAVAWEALLNRYSNTYLLKKKHLQSLLVHSKVSGKTAAGLRVVVEDFQRHVKILNQLNEPTHWGSLLVQLLCSRVDDQTLKEWEELVSANEEPTYENLIAFLTRKIRTLESLHISAEQSTPSSQGKHNPPVRQPKNQTPTSSKINSYAAVESYQPECLACSDHHPLVKCPVFEKMQLNERLNLINTKRICSNCFRSNHFVRNCQSNYSCKHCRKRHHSLLHPGFDASVSNSNPNSSGQPNRTIQNPPKSNEPLGMATTTTSSAISSNSAVESRGVNVFLSTVVVKVLDGYGNKHPARALLDSGSQSSLMSDRLCQKLRLFRHSIDQPILGVGESPIRAVCAVSTEVRSRVGDFSIPLSCLVLKKLTADLPAVTITTANWHIPNDIILADPEYNVSRKVDLIIGAEHFYAILQGGRLQIGPQAPTLVESRFGWLVSGTAYVNPMPQSLVCCTSTLETLNENIEKIWKLEELDTPSSTLSHNDQYCEEFYKETVSRDSTGRYTVKYPKKEGFEAMIGESFSNAKSRLESLERKLDKNPILKERYHAFMAEFIQLGHMREVPMDEPDPTTVCYLPHHAVLKEASSTTKVRSVFNASAKTSTGFSLNDSLLVGPVIQDELFDILLRFRKNLVVLLADIEKMYRQIGLHPDDRPLLRVLWRFNQNDPICTYEMTTVTYGLGPSSFLATRTLHQLADDEGASLPLAAAAVKRDFYMDDFVRTEENIATAIQLRKEMDELMTRGGFSLRKWCSNFPEVLEGVPHENLAHPPNETREPGEVVKALGISWEPTPDLFCFKFGPFSTDGKITKNRILSVIAQLYDPLGLIAPIVVRAKIFVQQLWLMSIDWNEEVPKEARTMWERFVEDLSSLAKFRIPRFAFDMGEVQLHCFTDASESAYGACIYARTAKASGEVKVILLAAKSRVAPLQKRSIPRLELCAAQLGARLSSRVVTALDMESAPIYYWTDSMVVVYWLRAPPQTWKTFVANRVADIHTLTKSTSWQHVPGVDNSADVVSRGLTVQQLLNCKIWTNGPAWLGRGEEDWPKLEIPRTTNTDGDTERKTTTLLIQNPPPLNPLFTRSFSYNRLIRTTAYCLRFIRHARKGPKQSTVTLTTTELENARDCLVKIVQAECYKPELHLLKKGKPVPKSSSLRLLNPFVDASGIIRVGGRLNLSMETYSTKHQILLPGFHRFTRMLLLSFHNKLVHGGIALTLGVVRNEYWPTNGRRAVRSVVRTCYRCTRANPRPLQQPIGQIPLSRITPSRPFASTGIDYCGPVFVKSANRKTAPTKAYIALFVGFSTKAVHIELVGDLSTASFLSALQRFVARRGKPENIYSDNATNFVGARNELHALYKMLSCPKETDRIATTLATDGIQWNMIPPRAPNFGGLWEAAVKVAKKHLLRQLGSTSLLYEDLVTILSQIEGALNSRPLAPLSEDPNDFEAITPSHFLIGSQLQALPHPDLKDVSMNRLRNRYQVVQQKQQLFWYHWRTEYLKELQRQSATNPLRVDLKVGQVMILQDDQLPPVRWPLVRIVDLHPGTDGVTRVVTVRTPTGTTFKRAVVKLCPLPMMDEEESKDAEDSAKPPPNPDDIVEELTEKQ